MRKLNTSLLSVLFLSTLLTACGGGSSNYDFDKPVEVDESALPHGPIFDPAKGKIPTPNDLLFTVPDDKPELKDGTLNIPNPSNNPVLTAINKLDGASTTNPMISEFGTSIDAASLTVGDSIRIFEVTKTGPAVTGVVRELTAAEILVLPVGADATTLALVPVLPLKESTSYLVLLTNKIKGADGKPAQSSNVYALTKGSTALTGDFAKLEPLRQLVNNMETVGDEVAGVPKADVVMSWSFTTQSITAVLNAVAADAKAGTITMTQTPFNTGPLSPGIDYNGLAFAGAADVHVGTLAVPYYLEAPTTQNPTAPLTGYWKGMGGSSLTRFNTTPVATKTLTIPVMMTTPSATANQVKPAGGWPIVIYQHGITRVRTDMLIYADSLAKAGFALIAIDLPLHGVTDATNPFYAGANKESTFDVDYMNNTTQAPGPDGVIDSSGSHYINLSSLLTARDNTRQGVSNLLVLRRSLDDIADIDASNVGFIAHSLGGVVGVPYLGVEGMPTPSALITTGGPITTIIRESAFFGPVVKGALAAQGVTGADYEKFLQGAQWVLDSSDPINYSMDAVGTHPIMITEVIGGGIHLKDQTVPNSATDAMAALMGAQSGTLADNPIAIGSPKIIRFIQGDHSSILDPTDDVPAGVASYINVFTEMHSQLASFMKSGGTKVSITDDSIIKK